jgi:menaquinone-9 beta-reductase
VQFVKTDADVVVIGGGPAGLAAAIAVRRKGFTVALADGAEPPIDKPCGEGLLPQTLLALRRLAVELPVGQGHRLRGIRFVAGDRQIAAHFPHGQGMGIRRPILHRFLVEESERLGVRLFWKMPVRGIVENEVHLTRGTLAARWIVGADGSGSRVRRWAGLDGTLRLERRNAVRRHYRVRPWSEDMEVHWTRCSQAYVTPISSGEVCIVVMATEAGNAADFERTLAELPELRDRLTGAEIASRERGAMTAMHSLKAVARGNIALVGDASGTVDAITGEGLRLSFRQAAALADAVQLGDLASYRRAHRHLARRPMWMGCLMLQLGKHTWLRERAMRTMQRTPELFERLLATHVGEGTPKDLLVTGARFGWQFLAA